MYCCRMLQRAQETDYINVNCVDPLGRTALLMAIDNENLEMVELLIEYKVDTKDALLHAISEEFVEAVEVLLEHEETIPRPSGAPHVSSPVSPAACNMPDCSLVRRFTIKFLIFLSINYSYVHLIALFVNDIFYFSIILFF